MNPNLSLAARRGATCGARLAARAEIIADPFRLRLFEV
jgi:hypothetical protein